MCREYLSNLKSIELQEQLLTERAWIGTFGELSSLSYCR